MKNIVAIALVACAIALIYFTASDVIRTFFISEAARSVSAKAQECAIAFNTFDCEKSADFMYPPLIQRLGGRKSAIKLFESIKAEMMSRNGEILSATVGNAEEPRMVGNLMISTIPETIHLKTPSGKFRKEGTLLGISPDKGTTWYFLELGLITQQQFRMAFPELADHVTMPPRTYPILE
jgi:hypothetical protein